MGESKMDIEVQNMDLKHSKISFDVQKSIFEGCFKTNMTFKIFWNVPGSFRPDFISIFYDFQEKTMNTEENNAKSIFLYKIFHFYTLWGGYL